MVEDKKLCSTNLKDWVLRSKGKLVVTIVILGICSLIFTVYQSDGKEAARVVDTFLTRLNNTVVADYDLSGFSYEYSKNCDGYTWKFAQIPEGWELEVSQGDDATYIVDATWPLQGIRKRFKLASSADKLKIIDTYKVLDFSPSMVVIDEQWDLYWDKRIGSAIKEIEASISVWIIGKSYYSKEGVYGGVELVNDSTYDLSEVQIMVDHRNFEGKSINTDIELLPGIIKASGHRRFTWYTPGCKKCVKQYFSFKFRAHSGSPKGKSFFSEQ
jgi:hypothetical protein